LEPSTLYTRCSACHTVFKVNNKQLSIAKGKVRCGACLSVFQASDYLVQPLIALPLKTTLPQVSFPQLKTSKESLPDSSKVKSLSTSDPLKSTENKENIKPIESTSQIKKVKPLIKESIDNIQPSKEKPIATEMKIPAPLHIKTPHKKTLEKSSNQPQKNLEKEPEKEKKNEKEVQPTQIKKSTPPLSSIKTKKNQKKEIPKKGKKSISHKKKPNKEEAHKKASEHLSISDPLDEYDDLLENEEVGFQFKNIFIVLIILSLIALFQVWRHRQNIAWSDTWGPLMKTACSLLPCDLKPKRALNKIRIVQNQVSPHTTKEKTLDIKILFVNEASFFQPYPVIKIIFSDKNGQSIYSKRFKPSFYLKSASNDESMPPNTEIQIQFDTKIEHSNALGFEFIFE
jgi:predicted Zn finger-like uncharacterized protein